jgi:integrase
VNQQSTSLWETLDALVKSLISQQKSIRCALRETTKLASPSTFDINNPAPANRPTGGTIVAAEVAPLTSSPSSPESQPPITTILGPPAADAPANGRADPGDESLAPHAIQPSPQDAMDFLLHPVEVERGRRAAENYLSTCRNDETRRFAEEALETLATVISGGHCDSLGFPWQQVRPFHGAAALTILKEKGAPARVEALRCRRDSTRSYRVVPESYPPGQVQKIRTTLTKVIEECSELGFVRTSHEDSLTDAPSRPAKAKTTASSGSTRKTPSKQTRPAARGRLLGDGELRALSAACSTSKNAEGSRDAVFFSLVNSGLKIAEITGLTLDSVRFSNKTGICSITSQTGSKGAHGRRVELSNDEMICLEDWLDYRGNRDGPLLCTVGRANKIEGKRLSTAFLKELCERRAKQAEVAEFVPNDLSHSAEALTQHRKDVKKRAAKQAQNSLSDAERVLFANSDDADGLESKQDLGENLAGTAIRFPFLGLSI